MDWIILLWEHSLRMHSWDKLPSVLFLSCCWDLEKGKGNIHFFILSLITSIQLFWPTFKEYLEARDTFSLMDVFWDLIELKRSWRGSHSSLFHMKSERGREHSVSVLYLPCPYINHLFLDSSSIHRAAQPFTTLSFASFLNRRLLITNIMKNRRKHWVWS